MAVIKFSQSKSLRAQNEVAELKEEVRILKRDLIYILSHLDELNFSKEFLEKNNLK